MWIELCTCLHVAFYWRLERNQLHIGSLHYFTSSHRQNHVISEELWLKFLFMLPRLSFTVSDGFTTTRIRLAGLSSGFETKIDPGQPRKVSALSLARNEWCFEGLLKWESCVPVRIAYRCLGTGVQKDPCWYKVMGFTKMNKKRKPVAFSDWGFSDNDIAFHEWVHFNASP